MCVCRSICTILIIHRIVHIISFELPSQQPQMILHLQYARSPLTYNYQHTYSLTQTIKHLCYTTKYTSLIHNQTKSSTPKNSQLQNSLDFQQAFIQSIYQTLNKHQEKDTLPTSYHNFSNYQSTQNTNLKHKHNIYIKQRYN